MRNIKFTTNSKSMEKTDGKLAKSLWFISIVVVGCFVGISGCSKDLGSEIGKKAVENNQKATTKEGLKPLRHSDVIEVIDPKTNLVHEVLYSNVIERQASKKETEK